MPNKYDAFISYARASNREFAPAVYSALQRFASAVASSPDEVYIIRVFRGIDTRIPLCCIRATCYLLLKEHGYDAIHTLDSAEGNRTTDNQINEISWSERRTVISKDADSFLIVEIGPQKKVYKQVARIRYETIRQNQAWRLVYREAAICLTLSA